MFFGHKFIRKIALIMMTVLIGSTLTVSGAAIADTTTTAAAASAGDTGTANSGQNNLGIQAKSAILMDADTGEVLYDFNGEEQLPPASMTKMMTEYLVLDNIEAGKITWDQMVTTSNYAASVGGSGSMLAAGEQLSVKDMFYAMSIYSANDATIALAELIGGTEENFVKMMNAEALRLGMSANAHFIDSTGLDRSDLQGNDPKDIPGETNLSAMDSAILAQRLIKDHKEILDFASIPSRKLRPADKTPMVNWDWMLAGNKGNGLFDKFAYPGLDGIKTGSTDNAGYCFTGTAVQNGIRLISVVMGVDLGKGLGNVQMGHLFDESKKLLDYGFNNYEMKQVVTSNSVIDSLASVPIKKGIETSVGLQTASSLSLLVKKGTTDAQIVQTTVPADASKLVAPIKKGDQLGTLTVTYNHKSHEIKLVAVNDVKKASRLKLFFRSVHHFFVQLGKSLKHIF